MQVAEALVVHQRSDRVGTSTVLQMLDIEDKIMSSVGLGIYT